MEMRDHVNDPEYKKRREMELKLNECFLVNLSQDIPWYLSSNSVRGGVSTGGKREFNIIGEC
ncbi:MAG: hypothetical protein Ct9H300mP29_7690 [Candidatus Neomarinimicrobiota bacterium]|nr:MAG: hypothetical protein Ct9H300mP29_7690 [Candidatus Neomarinimicrobiota bacterium]